MEEGEVRGPIPLGRCKKMVELGGGDFNTDDEREVFEAQLARLGETPRRDITTSWNENTRLEATRHMTTENHNITLRGTSQETNSSRVI